MMSESGPSHVLAFTSPELRHKPQVNVADTESAKKQKHTHTHIFCSHFTTGHDLNLKKCVCILIFFTCPRCSSHPTFWIKQHSRFADKKKCVSDKRPEETSCFSRWVHTFANSYKMYFSKKRFRFEDFHLPANAFWNDFFLTYHENREFL